MSTRAPLAPPHAEPAAAPPARVPASPLSGPAWTADAELRVPAGPSRFAHEFSGVRLRAPAGAVQPKLVVGAADDAYEREADRVAEAVMEGPRGGAGVRVDRTTPEERVQRLCPHCSAAGDNAHELEEDEEPEQGDEPVRAKAAPGRTPTVSAPVERALDGARGGGHPLDPGTRAFFEPRLGVELAGVRVHTGPEAARAAGVLGARAFTRGDHIWFAAGEYAPGTDAGRRLMAHELAHTLQQRGGGPGTAVPAVQRTPAAPSWSGGGGTALADPPSTAPSWSPSPGSAAPPASPPASAATAAATPAPSAAPAPSSTASPSTAPAAPAAVSASPAAAPAADAPAAEGAAAEGTPAEGTAEVGAAAEGGGTPGEMLRSLGSVPPSALAAGVSRVSTASAQAHASARAELAADPPSMEQPTGMAPVAPAAAEGEATAVPRGQAPELPPGGPAHARAPETAVPEPGQPVPGSTQPVAVAEPVEQEEGGWFDWLVGAVRRFTRSLPTHDPALSTSAGPRPRVDTSGDADRARADRQRDDSQAEVAARRADADAAVDGDFGVGGIAPTVTPGTLRGRVGTGTGEGAQASAGAAAPEGRGEVDPVVRAGVDRAAAGHVAGQVDAAAAREEAERTQRDADQRSEREATRASIQREESRVRQEQLSARGGAASAVDGRRDAWRKENRAAEEHYTTASTEQRRGLDTRVDGEIARAEGAGETELSNAEQRAERERLRVEAEAERKRREAENQPRSFWQRARGAVSAFFDRLRRAVTALFEGLRSFVRGVISAAKRLVAGFIEAARRLVVGFIRAFGEALKVIASVALAAFPETAARARDWIDRRVEDAVEVVNRAADALRDFAMAALDALGAALDFILAVYQRAYELLIDGLRMLAVGLLEILERVGHLAEAARQMPDHFWGQMSEELLGSDVTAPLPFERSGPAPALAAAGPAPSTILSTPAAATAGGPPAPAPAAPAPAVLTASPVAAEQVEVDQVAPLNLDPAFVASLNLPDGGEVEFGNATDPSRTMAAVQADAAVAADDTAAPGLIPTPAAPATPVPATAADDAAAPHAAAGATTTAAPGVAEPQAEALPADPEAQLQQLMSRPVEGGCAREKSGEPATQAAVPEADRVYGPFTAGQRARYLLHQMQQGISQWFSCNWPWLLGAVVLGLAAFIVANILSGGAVMAALPALMQLVTVVMVGVALTRVALWVGEYLTKGWVGQIAAAAKSLARGLAVGAIELIFALIFDLSAILKAVREGARATMRATVAATRASITTLRRSTGQIARAAGRTIRNPGRAARVVAGVTMRRGRIVMRGVRAGFDRGVRSLDDLARRLRNLTRFRGFSLERHGRLITLYGHINPKIPLAQLLLDLARARAASARAEHLSAEMAERQVAEGAAVASMAGQGSPWSVSRWRRETVDELTAFSQSAASRAGYIPGIEGRAAVLAESADLRSTLGLDRRQIGQQIVWNGRVIDASFHAERQLAALRAHTRPLGVNFAMCGEGCVQYFRARARLSPSGLMVGEPNGIRLFSRTGQDHLISWTVAGGVADLEGRGGILAERMINFLDTGRFIP